MRCPVCQDTPLSRHSLEDSLAANACQTCSGHWVSSYDYWHWLEWRVSPPPKAVSQPAADLPSRDNKRAVFCPDCQHLMRKAKVGHGLEFYLDRCSHCGGVWFDQNEWELLHASGLDASVHLIFSEGWQAQIRQDEFKRVLAETYCSTLGEADYRRAMALKAWIDSHPNKGYLLSLLNQECLSASAASETDSKTDSKTGSETDAQPLTLAPYEHRPAAAIAKGNGHSPRAYAS